MRDGVRSAIGCGISSKLDNQERHLTRRLASMQLNTPTHWTTRHRCFLTMPICGAATYAEAKIASSLERYLDQAGIKPAPGEVHIFYIQGFTDDNGVVVLKDFQYLSKGNTFEDALRESFTLEHAPTKSRLDAILHGERLVGIYAMATAENGKIAIRGGSLSPDFYRRVRREGLALRDARDQEQAEAAAQEARAREQAEAAGGRRLYTLISAAHGPANGVHLKAYQPTALTSDCILALVSSAESRRGQQSKRERELLDDEDQTPKQAVDYLLDLPQVAFTQTDGRPICSGIP